MAEGKGRCDLLPLDVVADLLRYYERIPECYKGIGIVDAIHLFTMPPREESDKELIFQALFEFSMKNGWYIPTMLLEVSKHFEDGCKKYGEGNWRKGIPAHCYIDSALRHYFKWMRGDKDEPHDRAFCWNLLCLLWTINNRPWCDDIAREEEKPDGDG